MSYYSKYFAAFNTKLTVTTQTNAFLHAALQGRIWGEGAGGAHPTPAPEMNCGFLIQLRIQLVFCRKKEKKALWFIGVEVKHETRLKSLCYTP